MVIVAVEYRAKLTLGIHRYSSVTSSCALVAIPVVACLASSCGRRTTVQPLLRTIRYLSYHTHTVVLNFQNPAPQRPVVARLVAS